MKHNKMGLFRRAAAALLVIFSIPSGFSFAEEGTLLLSEIMADNKKAVITDRDGDASDWAEIRNTGSEPVLLSEYTLSDDPEEPGKFRFPDRILLPGDYAVIFLSGKDMTDEEMHAPFRLSADGEALCLFFRDKPVQTVEFGPQEKGISLALTEQGMWLRTLSPTPGAENRFEPVPERAENVIGEVCFNELSASEAPFFKSAGYDWIELKNNGKKNISLKGWKLKLNDEKEYVFQGLSLQHGGYLRILMTESTLSKTPCAGFSLPARGGTLSLIDPEGVLVSRVSWEDLPGNLTLGLPGDQGTEYLLLEKGTPEKKNCDSGFETRTGTPKLETKPGFYRESVNVTISGPEDAVIFYTLDGSVPTEKSPVYTGPFTVDGITPVRARARKDGQLMSDTVSGTYFVGLRENVCVVSVITDNDYLYGSNGILVNGSGSKKNYEQDWEYPASIEFFDESGERVIEQNCGMKVAGAISRQHTQKSLAFFARSAYGKDRFDFNPFPHRDYTSVKSFVLRNGGSEGLRDGLRFRDAMLTGLALDSACAVCDARPALVYINGKMWGHCNIRERANKYFVGTLENVPEEEWDQIDILTQDGTVSHGSNAEYKELRQFCRTHDLNQAENLQWVLERVDTDSLFDCMAYQMITGNMDMHNLRFYKVPGGKWKWMIYDLDTAMRHLGAQPIADLAKDVKTAVTEKFDHIPFAALMKVPEMKEKFMTRTGQILCEHFTWQKLEPEILLWHDRLEPIIRIHCGRWTSLTPENWEKNIRDKAEIMRQRPALIPDHLKKYFKLSDAEVEKYFGEFLRINCP